MIAQSLKIIVLGYLVRGPLGGMAWHHLQYVLGLARLGHEVHFLEDSDDYPSCYDPKTHVTSVDPTYGLEFVEQSFKYCGLGDRWAYYDAHTASWLGPGADRIDDILTSPDLLLNLSGINPIRAWYTHIPHRVLVDTDPAFTQIRHLQDPEALKFALRHTAFFSFGENIGRRQSLVPDDGISWLPTRQPVVLDQWSRDSEPSREVYTTVMQWESYKTADYKGTKYGMKSDSFAPFIDLPNKTSVSLELALGGAGAPRKLLKEKGWKICDPLAVTKTLATYQRYLSQSKAEFSVTKQGYVVSRSGWFSERSACYLATGRPVILQDTGFSQIIETNRGLFSFSNVEEARAAIEEVQANYRLHHAAAYDVAQAYFDSDKVLSWLIDRIFSMN